ncbi:bifunctional chorismate mutase/prephenate dehydrogenase [Nostoc sp. UCD121]|uniref:bifunctional chorismate mutase/prephenate dehydrogenase n=1 Tax=unclassified Nostoc TaxID=2593658 RepID=UPI001626D586|nr:MULTISPECIES: bifunctional chorismate mutase/prephenate dehydrogenase [unclassified Nostoc]MBC1218928.1 bifunctional chorismate mutase/prephenate dehydrogenase [Nostoc sp. UCD120]MBC1277626.1 bifunctional chorismate mutase/prephenate dehydrogenase [Nostoc sp. UCD121]MBC1296393.1 bifunctional chorismate mutase/prephenate dehydrogenase [Nostoc sp. UCD122]
MPLKSSYSDQLKKTDQSLIALLSDRISLLASEQPSLDEQLADVAPLLAQAGIPESVWAGVVKSCHASIPKSATNDVIPRQVTIIGGHGRMGRLFKEQLSVVGHNVSVLEHNDWEYADKLLSQAELVLVSVPIEYTVDVIKRAAKYLAPTTALCDITSIKTQPTQAMLEHHCGPVMGLHPMFGPNIKSFLGQKVVVCPGRNDDSFQWLLDFLKAKGGELIVCTPEEHDQMMVVIQATQHFCRFSLGVFLAQTRVEIEQSLTMSTPNYRQEIDIVKRLFSQNPNLCVDIMLATEERCNAISFLANTYSRLAKLVARKDREALIKEFENTQGFFEGKINSFLQPLNATGI